MEVLEVGADHLDLTRLEEVQPTAEGAEEFGARLARTHAAGAPAYGAGPTGWRGDGWFGPLSAPLPLPLGAWSSWGEFYAEARLRPLIRRGQDAGSFDAGEVALLDRVAERVGSGVFETHDEPARLHGDLWSGNLMWTETGVVLIDPAAHGGHPETDLALLALFGAPHLERIRAAYREVRPLADGWPERVGLHQLHCLLVHVLVFGGGYRSQTLAIARRLA